MQCLLSSRVTVHWSHYSSDVVGRRRHRYRSTSEEEDDDDDDDEASRTYCIRRRRRVPRGPPKCPAAEQGLLARPHSGPPPHRQSSTWIVRGAVAVFGILSFVSFVGLTSCSPLFYCHRLDPSPRRLYATKTSYGDVRSLQEHNTRTQPTWDKKDSTCDEKDEDDKYEDPLVEKSVSCGSCTEVIEHQRRLNETVCLNGLLHCHDSSKVSTEKEDDCQPISFYILARHGTRYNKLSNMNAMTEKLYRIRALIESHSSKGVMCDEDLNWLRSWKPRHTVQDDSKLSDKGWKEILEIGQRYGDLFGDILRRAYAPSLYEFRYTNYTGKGDRTRQSARAFAQGLWGRFENVEMIENPRPDWLLQFYEHCHKYLRVVGGQPVEDYEKFKTGREMEEVLRDVNRRLGLPENTMGFADVYLIFENCRLEHGLYKDSPWCSVLTPSMLEVIEYHQDVKYYWEDGYGHSISYEPACTLIDDILRHLEDETKLGRFRFAHSGTLDALYTRIGLFEDAQPLRANNFDLHRSHRLWTTSRSTPMAANIAFAKYRCLHPPLLRVKAFVNEDIGRPILIPGCSSPLCPLDTLRSVWRPIANNCDINRICEQTDPETDNEGYTETDNEGYTGQDREGDAGGKTSSTINILPP